MDMYVNDSLDLDLSKMSLDDNLAEDKKKCEEADLTVMWYHGKVSRSDAEQTLRELMRRHQEDHDGLFMVRDSTTSDVDFSLSFIHNDKCYHFYIHRTKEGFYCIDGGPLIQGLEKLIEHYTESAHKLPARLSKLCKGSVPPASARKSGPTNLLHRVVANKREDVAKNILAHKLCPDVNAKNSKGLTALHEAATLGLEKTVASLLLHGADIRIKDSEGHTALHKACSTNKTSVCVILIDHESSTILEKNPNSGWVPLHVAAMYGHLECVEILLNSNSPFYPRSLNDETPVELAEKYRRNNCIKALENGNISIRDSDADFFHPILDRQGAERLFQEFFLEEGLFLIRKSKTVENQNVLSLSHNKGVLNYEIKSKIYRGHRVHFIDCGPYHPSLLHLVDYYHHFAEGTPVKLEAYISRANEKVAINSLDFSNKLTSAMKSQSLTPANKPQSLTSDNKPQSLTSANKPQSLTSANKQQSLTSANKPQSLTSVNKPHCLPKPVVKKGNRPALKPELPTRPPELESPPPRLTSPNIAALKVENDPQPLMEIQSKNLKKGHQLGEGEYGSVLKGVLTEKKKGGLLRREKHTETDVAIKTFHAVGSIEDFRREAHVMQSLQHEYIVQLLGVCQGPPLMLVEEFVPMGSMLDFLEDHPNQIRVREELYLWAAQIAMGMMYLETKSLVHRDLAARNILLKSLQHVKISDFGLSRAMGSDKEYYKASKGGRWPIKWYAPESVNFGHFSHASDVWSYGVTLWEMFTYGCAPFVHMSGVEVIKYIEEGKRLLRPEKCTPAVYGIMTRCWSLKPENRPTFTQLNRMFDEDPEYVSTKEIMSAIKTRRAS